MADEGLTRRQVIGTAGKAALAVGLGSVLAPSAGAASSRRAVMKNDKVVFGLIGCGGMGAADMRNFMNHPEVEVAAVCDVDTARMGGDINTVTAKYGRAPEVFRDYRKMLERKDIDAIIVGTPDHWHALNLIHACEAGKDVYCEKPISHDIVEARAMVAAQKHFDRVVQVGTWQRSSSEFTSAIEFVRSGKLGKVVLVRAWKTDEARLGHHTPEAVPATFDYDLWMGPSSATPFVPAHTHGTWRYFLNRGSGIAGDWGVHMIDIGLLAMSPGQDLVMPAEVTTYGGKLAWPDDDRTAPDTMLSIMRFKNPDFVLHWEIGRDHPGRPDHGTEFVTADGKSLMVWRGGWSLKDASGELLPTTPAPATNDHWSNFLECVKSRRQPRADLPSLAQTTIVCHLANASLQAGETVSWDKAKMDLVGKAGRNTSSYAREYRKPWKLPVYKG